MKNLPKIIKELRKQAGLNSKELAVKSGLSPAYISKLESGAYESISLKSSKQLSEGLGLTLKTLLERLGFINTGEKQGPGVEMISHALSSNGYTKEMAKQIIEYAEYLKKNKK